MSEIGQCLSNSDEQNQIINKMTKIEQLRCIDNYIDDNMSKEELRELIYELISNESLIRSFRMFSSV